MTAEIPLFPLRTVLFPEMPLPLRIFEERYLTMTHQLLESGGVFGVLLIRQGQETGGGAIPFDVGTTAVIEESEQVEGGRFIMVCRGVARFRLLRMLPPAPYPRGEIEYIVDRRPSSDARLETAQARVKSAFPEYFRLAQALTDQWGRPFSLPADPHALVNLLGPWLKADELEKQQLLELEEPAERVVFLAELLEKLLAEVRPQVEERRRRRYGGLSGRN